MKKIIISVFLSLSFLINSEVNATQYFVGESYFLNTFYITNLKIKHIDFNELVKNDLKEMLKVACQKELQSQHLRDLSLFSLNSYGDQDLITERNFNDFIGFEIPQESNSNAKSNKKIKNIVGFTVLGSLLGLSLWGMDQIGDTRRYPGLTAGNALACGAGTGFVISLFLK